MMPTPSLRLRFPQGNFSKCLAVGLFATLTLGAFWRLEAAVAESEGKQSAKVVELASPPFLVEGGGLVSLGDRLLALGQGEDGLALWVGENKGWSWSPAGLTFPRGTKLLAWEGRSFVLLPGSSAGPGELRWLENAGNGWVDNPGPKLPGNFTAMQSAMVGSTLFLLQADPAASSSGATTNFWSLDLPDASTWRAEASFPGGSSNRAVAVSQYGMFCLFGVGPEGQSEETWMYRPVPLEGTAERGWRSGENSPTSLDGAAAVAVGQAQLLIVGGGGGSSHPLLYNTVTDAWSAFAEPLALTSPAIVRQAESVLVLGTSLEDSPAAVDFQLVRTVRNLSWVDYAVIVGYFVLLTFIGLFFTRHQESSLEFSLGNRSVKWWAAGISMFATGASAISFMAIPALAFATNLVWLFPLLVFIPAYFVTAYLIFPLLRRMEITSTYEYLERRFNRTLRLIASLQCILFQTVAKTSVVLVLPALAISSVTGINVYASVIIMGVITTIYTAIGGFEAVIWTEVFQAALMLLAPLAIIFLAIAALPGGAGEFIAIGQEMHKFDFALITWDVAVPAFWILMMMQFLTVTVSVAGDQPIIQRVFSAPLKEVRKVNAMSTFCGILIGVMVNLMGLAIFAYFHTHPWKLDPMAQNDQIVPLFVAQAMPVGAAGMVIAAIFAASMSTVASVMNSVATIFTEDFYLRFRPQATDGQRLFCLRASSYIVGILGTCMALVLATLDLKSMMVVWSQLGALLGGGIVGVYTLGMFTTRTNGFGAIVGAILSIVITALVKIYTPLHWATLLPIAILTCIIFGYLFSFLSSSRRPLEGLTVFTSARRAP